MKERPIIFSTEMVKAILEGRKTQTRRVITPHTSCLDWGTRLTWKLFDWLSAFVDPGPSPAGNPGPYLKIYEATKERLMHRIYPRVSVGDLLYVRETMGVNPFTKQWVYRAGLDIDPDFPIKWKPSIHMPKKFARIWLEVKDVRVERVQEISETDAISEGVHPISISTGTGGASYKRTFYTHNKYSEGAYPQAREAFENLWDSINAKRGYGWKENPWVWVVEFERIEK